jgi:hypothetical protein
MLTFEIGGALSLGDDFKALENMQNANEMVRLIGARWRWIANVPQLLVNTKTNERYTLYRG